MKKNIIALAIVAVMIASCTKSEFTNSYTNPAKISQSTVEKQFTGFLGSNRWYVLPDYWNYFVVLRTTLSHYTQAVGFANAQNQYVPGEASIGDRWSNYYTFLAQYRNFEKLYNALPQAEKDAKRIYMIAATIYLYDHTEKVVDLHGDIPFFDAGKISVNGGDYSASLAKYDKAEDIYTKMLDDLKAFSTELNAINVASAILTGFKTQDFINKGDLTKWKVYCNSLRLRMLTRVSSAASFQARATTERNQILSAPSTFPIIEDNSKNIYIKVYDLNSEIHSKNFRSGLEDWNGNIAGKLMIDFMNNNADPRLRVMYEPGEKAGGVYSGINQLDVSSVQNQQINDGKMAIYNRSTLSRNQFFPGMLINAAEVSFLVSEAKLKAGDLAGAKTAYNNGIKQSIDYYYWLRSLSNDNTVAAPTAATPAEIDAFLISPGVNWDAATTEAARLNLIATQKWIHFSVIQLNESWAEVRRLAAPAMQFEVDNSNALKQPPVRWIYPTSEKIYNTANYNAVSSKDNFTTKLFWHTK